MKNNDLLRQLLIDEEGCELEAYKDSEGIWTIGIGHNLEEEQSEEELAVLGLDEELEDWGDLSITEQQAFELFDLDVEEAVNDLYPAFTDEDLSKLNETRYAVLISMTFQMGGPRVRKFKNFIQAVKVGDWNSAADEMLYANPETKRPTRWFIQTSARCQRAAEAMRHGAFGNPSPPVSESELSDKTDLGRFSDAELITELYKRLVKGL